MPNPQAPIRSFWPDGRAQLFINGEWREGRSTPATTLDPSTGAELALVAQASAQDVDDAVSAAAAAQLSWTRLTLEQRCEYLVQVATSLASHADDLALLEAMDSGNPIPATLRDMGLMQRYLHAWPRLAAGATGRASRDSEDALSIVLHEPYGVVGRIIAFNHPSLFALGGSIFALTAGNTMVVKAAPQTPLATLALGKILQEHLPVGVFNIVAGGAATGDALVTHPRVKRLAFTGSLPTALAIQNRLSASGGVKHLTTELGGKNAMVVFPDVDLGDAVSAAISGMSLTVSAGQSCQATSRLFVHSSIAQEFTDRLAAGLAQIRVTTAYADDAQMGPLVSAAQLDKVQSFVRGGLDQGARLVCGGDAPKDASPRGYFLNPTLFTDVTPDMKIVREEIFGPVITLSPWTNYEKMIHSVNDTDLGLSATIWTRDIDLALTTASDIHAGYIWVNDANRHYLGAPFGGYKNSGVGSEESIEELHSYWQTKAVNIGLRRRPNDDLMARI